MMGLTNFFKWWWGEQSAESQLAWLIGVFPLLILGISSIPAVIYASYAYLMPVLIYYICLCVAVFVLYIRLCIREYTLHLEDEKDRIIDRLKGVK